MFWILLILTLAVAAVLCLYFYKPHELYHGAVNLALRLTGFQRRSLTVDDEHWHYLEGGASNSAVMVLLHGFGANKESWLPYARLLTAKYRVIVPDLPGFGESAQIMDKDYSSKTQANRLYALLTHLGIEHCHLSGNSMGGLIAARYAIAFQQSVESLTLFNNAGIDSEQQTPFFEKMFQGDATLVARSQEEFKQILALVTHRPMKIPANIFRVLAEDSIARAPLLDHIFASLKEEVLEVYLNQYLPEIKVPTLVLWGRQDNIFDCSHVNIMLEHIPDSHGVILESTGHVPMLERPGDTVRHQLHFLETRALTAGQMTSENVNTRQQIFDHKTSTPRQTAKQQ